MDDISSYPDGAVVEVEVDERRGECGVVFEPEVEFVVDDFVEVGAAFVVVGETQIVVVLVFAAVDANYHQHHHH